VVAQRLDVVGLQLTIVDDWALVTAADNKVVIERSAIVAAERKDFIVLVITVVVSLSVDKFNLKSCGYKKIW